ncbi:nuclear transport factor 2 family protein [Nocardia salmonicida]|uniref:Nuclear transport factor 2 family protein n=1 Tax=Nocardia salmonicida TaxID=53431 RepID=A0ABZ1NHB7_9NOCA
MSLVDIGCRRVDVRITSGTRNWALILRRLDSGRRINLKSVEQKQEWCNDFDYWARTSRQRHRVGCASNASNTQEITALCTSFHHHLNDQNWESLADLFTEHRVPDCGEYGRSQGGKTIIDYCSILLDKIVDIIPNANDRSGGAHP